MREIKFKAYYKNKIWNVESIDFGHNGIDLRDEQGKGIFVDGINNVELIQYSNFKDKNGQEIWEGDTLKIYDENYWNDKTEQFDELPEVNVYYSDLGGCLCIDYEFGEYDTTTIGWALDNFSNNATEVEVIGNIYENTELPEGTL